MWSGTSFQFETIIQVGPSQTTAVLPSPIRILASFPRRPCPSLHFTAQTAAGEGVTKGNDGF
jgi:hypothetical protein